MREKEVRTNVKHCKNPCRAPEKEFQEVVLKYWRRFGLKPEKYWFDWFGQGENHYNKYFIPDNIWYEKITPYFNNLMFKRAIADKGMFDILIPEVKQPRTVVKNRAGIFYDGKGNVITKKEALILCIQEEKFIAKPTLGGGAGKDIHFYDKTKDTKEKIEKIFSFYQNNFIVQEIVEQHEILSNLNESSLNSMRVLSIFFKMRFTFCLLFSVWGKKALWWTMFPQEEFSVGFTWMEHCMKKDLINTETGSADIPMVSFLRK